MIGAIAFIGLGIVEQTYDAVGGTVSNTTTLDLFHDNIANTYSTLGGMLPIVVLALVGGLAVFYILRYLAGAKSE